MTAPAKRESWQARLAEAEQKVQARLEEQNRRETLSLIKAVDENLVYGIGGTERAMILRIKLVVLFLGLISISTG